MEHETKKNTRKIWVLTALFAAGLLFFVLSSQVSAVVRYDPYPEENDVSEDISSPTDDVTFSIYCKSGGIFGASLQNCYGSGYVGLGQVFRVLAGPEAIDVSGGDNNNGKAVVDVCINNSGIHSDSSGYCWAIPHDQEFSENIENINAGDFRTFKWLAAKVVVKGSAFNDHFHQHRFWGFGRTATISDLSASSSSVKIGSSSTNISATGSYSKDGQIWVTHPDGFSEQVSTFGGSTRSFYPIDYTYTPNPDRGSGTAEIEFSAYGPNKDAIPERIKNQISVTVNPADVPPPSGTIRSTIANNGSNTTCTKSSTQPCTVVLDYTTTNATSAYIQRNNAAWKTTADIGTNYPAGTVTDPNPAPGTYTYTLFGSNASFTNEQLASVTVQLNPEVTPPPPPPSTNLPDASFWADPTTITQGSSSTLHWTSTNATAVSINQGIGSVSLNGTRSVSPGDDITYTATVSNSAGSITRTATIIVNPPGCSTAVNSFSANPSTITQGSSSTLNWTTTNATSVSIDQGIGSVSGSARAVSPSQTTTYTITATKGSCSDSKSVDVTVLPPASGPSCSEAHPQSATTEATSGNFTITATGVANVVSMYFPTWTDTNGQDDIIWYSGANNGGGTWTASVNLASHPGLGTINVHVYMNGTNGSANAWCDSANFSRTAPAQATGTVIVSISPAGIKNDNGQDPAYYVQAPDQTFGWRGSNTFTNRPVGNYCVVNPESISGRSVNNPGCQTLNANQTISFSVIYSTNAALGPDPEITFDVQYTQQSGTLNVSCNNPPAGSWEISGIGHRDGPSSSDQVAPGNYTVIFNPVSGYNTPGSQTASVTKNSTTNVSCNYTRIAADTGTLNVSCNNPPGGAWDISGVGHRNGPSSSDIVAVGSYTVTFNPVSGYNTPGSQTATVRKNQTTSVSCTYTPVAVVSTLNAPTITSLDNSSCNQVIVNWSYTSNGVEESFTVFRSTSAGSQGSQISGSLPASARSYTDSSGVADTSYYYIVKAHTTQGGSREAASSQRGPVLYLACTANLGNSSKTLAAINGSPFSSSTVIKSGDTLTFQITVNNAGPGNATINYICDSPSSNLSNLRSLQVSGGGSNGGITPGSSSCSGGYRLNVSGAKAVGNPNWVITFDGTFQSTTADQFEVCSNSATINYTDTGSRTKGVSFGPFLCKTGKGTAPNFREVAP